MKLKNRTSDITFTQQECQFLVDVLLDWDQKTQSQTKQEKQLWSRTIAMLDNYTAQSQWRASD
jgi:hypothetical protein